MSDESYARFFSEFGAYLSKEKERKIKRGNNDYNPLLVIRSAKDEAKLHTRILHSFLDTNGVHCQDDLFLRLFLESLNLKEWFGDTANARVAKEYYTENGFMDLYIHNDKKHIIVENKVDSNDSDKQIAKYIDSLCKNGYENVAVVYLTKMGDELSDKSRDKWQIKGDFLERGNDKVLYRQIAYANEILLWIESCQSKSGVGNIANLNYALESYKDAVQIITNTKEDKMSMETFLKENRNFIALVAEIKKIEIESMCVNLFKSEVASKAEFSEWEFVDNGMAFGFCHKDYLKQTFKFMLTLEKTLANRYLGFRLHINGKDYPNDLPKRLKDIVERKGFKLNVWNWWLCDENGNDMVDLTKESLEEYFMRRYKNANALNELLKNDSEVAKLASEVK